jgi:hypothetical protein
MPRFSYTFKEITARVDQRRKSTLPYKQWQQAVIGSGHNNRTFA